jgi:hypothetical protein
MNQICDSILDWTKMKLTEPFMFNRIHHQVFEPQFLHNLSSEDRIEDVIKRKDDLWLEMLNASADLGSKITVNGAQDFPDMVSSRSFITIVSLFKRFTFMQLI